MSSTVTFIVKATINPEGKDELATYLKGVGKLYEKVKAKLVAKYKISQSLIGEDIPSIVSIMEFSSIAALNSVFDSDAYKALIPGRDIAFSKLEAYISE